MSVPNSEPQKLIAGESWQWDIIDDEFPASTWTLTYDFLSHEAKPAQFSIVALASGDDHQIREDETITALYKAQTYSWKASYSDGTDIFFTRAGTMEVDQDPGKTNPEDPRSWAKISLDAVEANLQNKASIDQQRYRLGDVELQRMDPEDLLTWRDRLRALYEQELQEEQATQGKNSGIGFASFTPR